MSREPITISEESAKIVLLDRSLKLRQKAQVKRMYAVLKTLEGKGSPDITDACATIDRVLYGENSAWKGSGE